MRVRLWSLVPSALGVVIVMSGEPAAVDYVRSAVCFLIAVGMCWAGELKVG